MEVREMKLKAAFLVAIAASSLTSSGSYAQDVDVGATLFAQSCSACHGAKGLGDGDMANVTTIKAPNLTLLSKNNDGVFPMLQVIHVIDGRTGQRGHGSVMPVWGQIYSDEAAVTSGLYGGVLETRGRILSLALFIESMQK
jgi:mono/diheme cytochrome c family protein